MANETTQVTITETWTQIADVGDSIYLEVISGSPLLFAYASSAPSAASLVGHLLNIDDSWTDAATSTKLVAQIGPQFGGAGLAGIGFGTGNDVALYRLAAGAIGQTGVLIAPNSTVASLPTPSSTIKGATAFATNGRRSLEMAGNGTGCPVWCDGSNWRTMYDNTVVAA